MLRFGIWMRFTQVLPVFAERGMHRKMYRLFRAGFWRLDAPLDVEGGYVKFGRILTIFLSEFGGAKGPAAPIWVWHR
jgi:hypothetical protein